MNFRTANFARLVRGLSRIIGSVKGNCNEAPNMLVGMGEKDIVLIARNNPND
jgi:hypothetical protein